MTAKRQIVRRIWQFRFNEPEIKKWENPIRQSKVLDRPKHRAQICRHETNEWRRARNNRRELCEKENRKHFTPFTRPTKHVRWVVICRKGETKRQINNANRNHRDVTREIPTISAIWIFGCARTKQCFGNFSEATENQQIIYWRWSINSNFRFREFFFFN